MQHPTLSNNMHYLWFINNYYNEITASYLKVTNVICLYIILIYTGHPTLTTNIAAQSHGTFNT